MSLPVISSLESGRRKFFINWTFIMSRKVFCHQLARIGEKKIFHELDVHLVKKVAIKRFWAKEAEMSLSAKSSLQSATRKFFINSTYIMSKK